MLIDKLFYETFTLPSSKVLAHIAGPSGSGKTELMYRLIPLVKNIQFIDLDELDDMAVDQLGWVDIPKNDYTDRMLRKLFVTKQRLLYKTIQQSRKPLIFFGHHEESGYILRIPTEIRILLNVSPRTGAIRRGKNKNLSREQIEILYSISKQDVTWLKNRGYISMSPRKIFNLIISWNEEMNENFKPYTRME